MINSIASAGVTTLGAMVLALTVLKLTGVITSPWWLVTLPLWGSVALVIIFIPLLYIIMEIIIYRRKRKSLKRLRSKSKIKPTISKK